MSSSLLDTLEGYMEAGGFVMPPLVLGAMLRGSTIGVRFLTLPRGVQDGELRLLRCEHASR